MKEYMLPCFSKKIFGIECFGCGLQRSLLLFVQGEFAAAFKMYPALYPLLLLAGVVVFGQFIKFKYFKIYVYALGILAAVLMVGNYILKNFM